MKQRSTPRNAHSREAGQAAAETVLIIVLIALVMVLLPDNAIERVWLAIEGRHQAIIRHTAMP